MAAPEGGHNIDQRIVPDGVHPNAAGMDTLGLCLDPTIAFLRGNPDAGEAHNFVDEVQIPASVPEHRGLLGVIDFAELKLTPTACKKRTPLPEAHVEIHSDKLCCMPTSAPQIHVWLFLGF